MTKYFNSYHLAVFLSSLSLACGLFRELLIIALFGFTATNDQLQLYLSIFYTIGLSIDAMRLSSLNLYASMSLSRILFAASIIALPFSMMIGSIMNYSAGGLNPLILLIAIIGSYLNLIAALLITYKQRNHSFLKAQWINILPNFVLIPGILLCYWFDSTNIVYSIVCLTSLIPIFQCLLLFMIPTQPPEMVKSKPISLFMSVNVFIRHFFAIIGEQLYQILTRTTFFHYGTGYLSVFSITIRFYSAIRFILIDTFIGSKLADWQENITVSRNYFEKMVYSNVMYIAIILVTLFVTLQPTLDLAYASIQMIIILILGFYFSTFVRIMYFKINRNGNNPTLVMQFALYEIICAALAFVLTKQLIDPILAMIWLGYVVKPCAQLLLIRKKFQSLEELPIKEINE